MSRFIERLIEQEIDSANDHLPVRKVPLDELIASDNPSFKTRGGEVSAFLTSEISMLAEEVPSIHHSSIRLPIVILRRRDLGSGIYTATGSKIELFLIQRFLELDSLGWDEINRWKQVERFARPQIQVLRRKLSSTTQLGFVGSSSPS
ncbi:MAG: DUF61 family protein [Candidatus Thorarchaeota archaeon]